MKHFPKYYRFPVKIYQASMLLFSHRDDGVPIKMAGGCDFYKTPDMACGSSCSLFLLFCTSVALLNMPALFNAGYC